MKLLGKWARRTDVGPVDEAEEVEQGDGGHDHEVDLPPQLGLGLWVELDEGLSMSVIHCQRGGHNVRDSHHHTCPWRPAPSRQHVLLSRSHC